MNIRPTATFITNFLVVQKTTSSITIWGGKFHATLVAITFLLLSRFFSEAFSVISLLFLVTGFIFPGMAHGALDYFLILDESSSRSSKLKILTLYIASVALGFFMWIISPLFILTLFLLHSAFHFGETELRIYSRFIKVWQGLYGILLILFFFFSHAPETTSYLLPFGVRFPSVDPYTTTVISLLLFVGLALPTLSFSSSYTSANLLLVLAIGTQLPLVVAFGIYYILIHSLSAWKHLQVGLSMTPLKMIKKATPFTLAGLIFIVIAFLFFQQSTILQHQPVPLIIIGLSAITLPHTLSMSFFYQRLYKNGTHL